MMMIYCGKAIWFGIDIEGYYELISHYEKSYCFVPTEGDGIPYWEKVCACCVVLPNLFLSLDCRHNEARPLLLCDFLDCNHPCEEELI